MKKLLLILLTSLLLLTSCFIYSTDVKDLCNTREVGDFYELGCPSKGNGTIVYHTLTGVVYLKSFNYCTPLYNADGSIMTISDIQFKELQ